MPLTPNFFSRDEVDSSHYPVFHQMEGVKMFTREDYGTDSLSEKEQLEFVQDDLKRSLEGMAHALFGNVVCILLAFNDTECLATIVTTVCSQTHTYMIQLLFSK